MIRGSLISSMLSPPPPALQVPLAVDARFGGTASEEEERRSGVLGVGVDLGDGLGHG